MKQISFAKLANQWYAVLPNYLGKIEELEMVAGADEFLDSIAGNKSIIVCIVSDTLIEPYDYHMKALCDHNGPTGYYRYDNKTLWLCSVNKYFWEGNHPENIYVKVISVI